MPSSVRPPGAGTWTSAAGCRPSNSFKASGSSPRRVLTGLIWLVVYQLGASIALSAGIAFVIGYAFRVTALYRAWEEPLAKEPTGVYVHDDGRPMLGRKLKGKSKRELESLGLAVHKDEGKQFDTNPSGA